MALKSLLIKPGVDVEATATLNSERWSLANLIRHREGLIEKLGGWARLLSTALTGTCRALHAWADLTGTAWIAAGTTQRLMLESGGGLFDITPIAHTSNLATPFATTANSAVVTVNDPGNGAAVGDWINLTTITAVDGLVLQGLFPVQSVIDGSHYTILAPNPANSSVAAGGVTAQFATTAGSPLVQLTLGSASFATGQSITVNQPLTLGGITLSGTYLITNTNGTMTINAGAAPSGNAVSSVNGGLVQVAYLLPAGPVSDQAVAGYGVGDYGGGDYGGGQVGATNPARLWSLDNFGQNLIACPLNGSIYQWAPPATTTPAQIIANAPSPNSGAFVAMPQEIIVAWGSSLSGVQDPMLLRWCDAGDFTDWTATAANQAGSFRLPRGSKILRGLQAPAGALLFTDLDLWGMQYIQPPLIWSFLQLASNCGLIAPKAAGVAAGQVYWLSDRGPYVLAGGAQPLPCSVWDILFQDLDPLNIDKIFFAANARFNEVAWFFPSLSGGTGEIDSYIKYNYLENAWDYGRLVRTAWVDQSFSGPPIGVDATGLLQAHDLPGVFDADGQAMANAFAQSGYQTLEDGTLFLFVDQLLPDFKWLGKNPSLQLSLYFTNYPGQTPTVVGPFTVTPSTTFISCRARGRQVAVRIESDGAGVWWRLGRLRFRVQPAGRHG